MNKRRSAQLGAALLLAASAATARADTVVFKNGDKLTGKIESVDSGKLKIQSDSTGEITVDMANVSSFSTDAPIEVDTVDGQILHVQAVAGGPQDSIKTADGQTIPFTNVKVINPPAQVWTGNITLNASMARGNTFNENMGLTIAAELRHKRPDKNDRTIFNGAYNFGLQKAHDTGVTTTTTDNWMGELEYNYFFTEKFYAYGDAKLEHDRIAKLNYRATPGLGVGYQWVERPDFNFNTEGGLSYVHEDFTDHTTNDYVAFRLAYHLTKQLLTNLSCFHDLQWLPSVIDPSKYTLDTDAGLHLDVTKSLFTELKVEWKRNSNPPTGAMKNDLYYTLGVGWKF